jgi:organic hydroperoxide reductase OsmC/OhrA
MDSIKPLFTAVASCTGGRNGHAEAEDHSVAVDLSVPKAMRSTTWHPSASSTPRARL